MMDLQTLFDSMSAMTRDTRSRYHLTLGAAIKQLSEIDGATIVKYDGGFHPCSEHSYRGYYSDLALDAKTEPTTAADLLNVLKRAQGATYQGYKGGDFVMGDDTPLWAASWGSCGKAIVGLSMVDGAAVLATKQVD